MGIARTEAMRAARDRHLYVAVMVEKDGKLTKEWTFDPPDSD
jgi:hypothetical protein